MALRQLLACFNAESTDLIVRRLVTALGEYYRQRENRGHHIDVPIAALTLGEVAQMVKPLSNLREQIDREMDNPHMVDQVEDAFRRAFRESLTAIRCWLMSAACAIDCAS